VTVRSLRFAADPLLAACLAGQATIQPGMTGGTVAKVQQALMDLGHVLCDYGPDGVFGAETSNAVCSFKEAAGLDPAEPVIDGRTMAAFDDRFAGEPEQPQDVDDRAPGELEPLSTGPSDLPRRAVEIALAAAAAGGHYLAGAAGAYPTGDGGTRLRSGSVTLDPGSTEPSAPAVFAARSLAGNRPRCAGRFDARNGGLPGGRPASPTDTDLIVYLAGLAATPEDRWKPFFQFYSPRVWDGGLVWGEDCRSKRHFDGAGFVNWCVEEATEGSSAVDFDMATWATDASGTQAVAVDAPPETGDIVLRALEGRFSHIGFLAGDADRGTVVLAEQPSVGVVRRRFSAAGWTARRRLTAPAPSHRLSDGLHTEGES
jgi:peptidoglycan hydrolase-like protein with peptidoglycan-binding domain